MSKSEIMSALFNVISNVNFFWNFYYASIVALVGWRLSAKQPFTTTLKTFIIIAFIIFASINYMTLHKAYTVLEALLLEIQALSGPKAFFSSAEAAATFSKVNLNNSNELLPLHIVIDIAVCLMFALAKNKNTDSDGARQTG